MSADAATTSDPVESNSTTHGDVRAVTDDEVAFFDQNGWVLLRGLVSRSLCHALLEQGKPRLAEMMGGGSARLEVEERREALKVSAAGSDGTVADIKQWVEWRGPVRTVRDPVFSTVALSTMMGTNVKRLLRRNKPLRILHDIFTCKLPQNISTPTDWHQDSVSFPIDRNVLTIWIALDFIRPEQGPVQFYSGSHRLGLLGRLLPTSHSEMVSEIPDMARFPVSPAHHLEPGDATVHHGLVLHGANANAGVDPRWSYLICYFPADARYSGAPNHDFDGFGLQPGKIIEHPSFSYLP